MLMDIMYGEIWGDQTVGFALFEGESFGSNVSPRLRRHQLR